MNVLFVTWDGPQVSYLESLFLPIFEGLRAHGYRFHVLQFTWGDPGRQEARRRLGQAMGIPYRAVQVWRRPVALGSALTALLGQRHIRQAVDDWGIELLLPRSTLPGWSALWALRRLALPLVFDADGLPLDERVDFAGQSPEAVAHRLLRDVEARLVRRADVVLTRSHQGADILLCRAGAGTVPAKFHVVGNGRCPQRFSPASPGQRLRTRRELGLEADAPLLAYAGSLGEQYCLPEMMSLLGHVHARCPAARLLLLTADVQAARAALARFPGQAGLVCVRAVAPGDVPRHLACADLGLALRRASFSMQAVSPIKIGEYLLCGLPVLASRDVGNVQALQGPCVFVPTDDGEAELRRAAQWFIETVLPRREGLREASRQLGLRHYTLQSSVQAYVHALSAVRKPA